jgi:hypothetical protein
MRKQFRARNRGPEEDAKEDAPRIQMHLLSAKNIEENLQLGIPLLVVKSEPCQIE